MLLRSDRASDAQLTFRSNIDGPYWHAFMADFFSFFPDSSQWGPVSQVNSWKLLHIIHHSLVPPAASFYSQNKQIRWLTVSCPPWGTCTPLWRIKSLDTKAVSLWPKNIFLGWKKKQLSSVTQQQQSIKKKGKKKRKTPCDLFSFICEQSSKIQCTSCAVPSRYQ